MKELLDYYKRIKGEIKNRLRDFRENYRKDDREIFSELCFCILTPQSDAVECDKAIKRLKERGLLFSGSKAQISPHIKAARFLNNKAQYLVEARSIFKNNGYFCVKPHINRKYIFQTREWLVDNVKGIGYKEASHFLRNIGLGEDIAILDTHILKNLKKYRVIKEISKSMTRKRYMDIEDRMRKFADRIRIPMAELDLLFWSKETGVVFK